jgi:peptidoglycan/xylan/chitin deacetylase (PgdA/CDA1 family)
MFLALKIDVLTRRAATDGVPALIDLLRRHRAGASFVGSTRCLDGIKAAAEAGFETGLLAADHRPWWRRFTEEQADAQEARLGAARANFRAVLGDEARLHAAAHWRATPHALRLTQRLGFAYASDTRGRHPFVPVWHGEIVRCAQFPTTLPTFDELGRPEIASAAIRDELLALTARPTESGHLFSLSAADTSRRHLDLIEALLTGWREQGYEPTSIQALAAGRDVDKLPRHEIVVGKVPGRHGTLLMQGEEFLSEWRKPT